MPEEDVVLEHWKKAWKRLEEMICDEDVEVPILDAFSRGHCPVLDMFANFMMDAFKSEVVEEGIASGSITDFLRSMDATIGASFITSFLFGFALAKEGYELPMCTCGEEEKGIRQRAKDN